MTDKTEKDAALKALFPGKNVALDERVDAVVFPLGVTQIKKFTDQLVVPFSALYRGALNGTSQEQIGAQLVGFLVPHVVRSMTEILDECVTITVDGEPKREPAVRVSDLPHHYLPQIAQVWVEESFGDAKKRDPWLAALKKTWATMTGEELSTSEMLSRFASTPATAGATSST